MPEYPNTRIPEHLNMIILATRAETARFGMALGAKLRAGDCVALIGDLGAGKTALTKGLARGMGIVSPVTSPTYTLAQEYAGPIPLFHADPYRLENPADVLDFGFEEYFLRGGVVVVEWADKIAELLPAERLTLQLEIAGEPDDDGEAPRRLQIGAAGARYEQMKDELTAQWTAESAAQ